MLRKPRYRKGIRIMVLRLYAGNVSFMYSILVMYNTFPEYVYTFVG